MSLDLQIRTAISLIICGSMAALGLWVSAYVRVAEVENVGETSAFYMNLLVEPLLRDVERDGVVPAQTEAELDALLFEQLHDHLIEAAVIWWRDGTVAYSTDKPMMGSRIPSQQLDEAFSGTIVAKFVDDLSDHGTRRQALLGQPLLEVYVPLRDPQNGAVTAVGEFYQNATLLREQLDRGAYTIWGIVVATTVLMLSLLMLIAARARTIETAHRRQLKNRLDEQRQLADQNDALRRVAEETRMSAFRANEDFLNQIGSDLHDGPIQLLSLIILRLRGDSEPPGSDNAAEGLREQEKTRQLAEQSIRDLRNLAFGLAVPELDELTVTQTLELAIERHESQTDTAVMRDLHDLPEQLDPPLKLCLYRIVQEALNNAFKHAGGRGQHVAAAMKGERIELVISDNGPGMDNADGEPDMPRLGIAGLTRRIQSFGGSLRVDSQHPGTTVTATLPVAEF